MNNQVITINDSTVGVNQAITFANSFVFLAEKTVENYIEMGKIVCEAKDNLKKAEFAEFCKLIKANQSSSSLKKLISVGRKYNCLKNNLEALPPNWTSVYKISQMTETNITECIQANKIHPMVLGRDLKTIINPNQLPDKSKAPMKVPNGTVEDYKITVVLPKAPDEPTITRIKKIIAECKALGAEVEYGATLEEFLAPVILAEAA